MMSIFRELEALYSEIDNRYAREEIEARSRGFSKKEQTLSRKRELNDHAYYLFMFTRLEDHVREQSSNLIVEMQGNLRYWKQRRAWDVFPKERDSDRIFFLSRVALLIDKGSHYYQKIKQYYDLRNTLGHGGNFSSPILIPTVVADFESFYKMLKS